MKELYVTRYNLFFHKLTLKMAFEAAKEGQHHAFRTTLRDRTAAGFP